MLITVFTLQGEAEALGQRDWAFTDPAVDPLNPDCTVQVDGAQRLLDVLSRQHPP